jgi:hypothetical protein
MPASPKVLAEGQLPDTKGTLYTAPSGGALVKFYRVHNSSATPQDIILYVNAGGTSREIDRATLGQFEFGCEPEGMNLSLESGDLIEGVTTTAAVVNYIITGVIF